MILYSENIRFKLDMGDIVNTNSSHPLFTDVLQVSHLNVTWSFLVVKLDVIATKFSETCLGVSAAWMPIPPWAASCTMWRYVYIVLCVSYCLGKVFSSIIRWSLTMYEWSSLPPVGIDLRSAFPRCGPQHGLCWVDVNKHKMPHQSTSAPHYNQWQTVQFYTSYCTYIQIWKN